MIISKSMTWSKSGAVLFLILAFAASCQTKEEEEEEGETEAVATTSSAVTFIQNQCTYNGSVPNQCSPGQRCVLRKINGAEVRQCTSDTDLSIYDEIRTEGTKLSNDPKRPLPLASVYCGGPGSEAQMYIRSQFPESTYGPPGYLLNTDYFQNGPTMNLGYQMELIKSGDTPNNPKNFNHILPVLDLALPRFKNNDLNNQDSMWSVTYHDATDSTKPFHFTLSQERDWLHNTWNAPRALLNGVTPMQALNDAFLPISIVLPQFEDMIDGLETSYWTPAIRNSLFHCPPYPTINWPANGGCYLTPFANKAHYTEMGKELANKNLLKFYREQYKRPAAVIFVSNNEAYRSISWLDAMAHKAGYEAAGLSGPNFDYTAVNPGVSDPNATQKRYIDKQWVDFYTEIRSGVQMGLDANRVGGASADEWAEASKWFVAYNSRPLAFETHIDNRHFKPDLYLYKPYDLPYRRCCENMYDGADNAYACRATLPFNAQDPGLPDGGRTNVCFHKDATRTGPDDPPTRCYQDDSQNYDPFKDCAKPMWPRSSLAGPNIPWHSLGGSPGTPNSSPPGAWDFYDNVRAAEFLSSAPSPSLSTTTDDARKAFHMLDDSWPATALNDPKPIDKWFRAWDGVLGGGFIFGEHIVDFMNGRFLLYAGFHSNFLDTQILEQDWSPNFWNELYTYHTGDILSGELVKHGQAYVEAKYPHLTSARARGMTQLFLWMNRPRIVRSFDSCLGYGQFRTYAERFFTADIAAVDRVWNESDLRSFWENSELVENKAYLDEFETRGIVPYYRNENGLPPKYWLLKTSSENIHFTSWLNGNYGIGTTTVMTDVSAIARRQDPETGPDRYLVYAFTQKPSTLKQVVITVPRPGDGTDTFNLTVDVEQGGSIFVVNDYPSGAYPLPTLAQGSPSPVLTGTPTLTLEGTGFAAATQVKIDSIAVVASYISGERLTVVVPQELATPGQHTVTVTNPGRTPVSKPFEVRAASCYDHLVTSDYSPTGAGATSGVYSIDPDGYVVNGNGNEVVPPFTVYCDQTTDGGGWALVAFHPAPPAALYPSNLTNLYTAAAPTPADTTAGIVKYFMTSDLRKPGAQLKAVNAIDANPQNNESYVFELDRFTGPIQFDKENTNTNFVDGERTINRGIIAGNTSPVLNHFQVYHGCAAYGPDCRQPVSSSSLYSPGLLMVFDWQDAPNNEAFFNGQAHAHFGGTPKIEGGVNPQEVWARRGKELWYRTQNLASRGARTSCQAHRDAGEDLDALYLIDPDGPNATAPFLAWCDMDGQYGWTLLVSQQEFFSKVLSDYYNGDAPTPKNRGILSYYMKVDLKSVFSHLRVANDDSDPAKREYTFTLSSFTGPLVIDGPGFYASGSANWQGIVAGRGTNMSAPVINAYQLGQVCSSGGCRGATTISDPSYSPGLLLLFDWHNSTELNPSRDYHAHFGGKSALESFYSRRGDYVYAR